MSKPFNPGRKSVELTGSRIRREPPPVAPGKTDKALNPYPTERETWTVIIGVVLFAIAFAIITVGLSDFTSR